MRQDALWYKDAIIYELHVRAFLDSNGDGGGDFRGLTGKLDYLERLGVTALWLLPFYPSPLRDDGYDIADYTAVHPLYGSLPDFRRFLREAHRRGLRVITELVLNHTSDQHPWFQRARRAPAGSPERDFYVWSDTPDRYRDARVIFQDFEPSNWRWDPLARAYYWHRFYSHQPDLNFDNPAVHEALLEAVDFWLDMGVDGMRLDAVPYLYEREGTSCESLPETHAFLKKLRAHVDGRYQDRMFLAEANQWPEEAATYFGDGDECHMNFHFPLMPRLFMALRREERFPITDILEQTPPIPDAAQWALFLRNHDELTLETVTDEDREFMLRFYARDPKSRINLGIRRRLAPLLGNSRRRIELMNGLLFSLPGTPVVYYGDELGMGDNIYLGDRDGVRTPMQWSADRNAGFSKANPQSLYLPIIIDPQYHYEAVNVDVQMGNPGSLLEWTRRLIALRKKHRAFGRGTMELLTPGNPRVLAFLRRHEDETILVVANLSRFAQPIELDLAAHAGRTPVELFGRTEFPRIGEAPYPLTLGAHSFYWFALTHAGKPVELEPSAELPEIRAGREWTSVLGSRARAELERALEKYLRRCEWFGRGPLIGTSVIESIPLPLAGGQAVLLLLRAYATQDESEMHLLLLGYSRRMEEDSCNAVARLQLSQESGWLYEASGEQPVVRALVELIVRRSSVAGDVGRIFGSLTRAGRGRDDLLAPLPPAVVHQRSLGNTVVELGERLILKLFRRVDPVIHPDLELGRFLTERGFDGSPSVLGTLEWRGDAGEPLSLATLQAYARHDRTALEAARASRERPASLEEAAVWAAELGRTVARMHLCLSSEPMPPELMPEPTPPHYRRSLYQTLRSLAARALHGQPRIHERLLRRLKLFLETPLEAKRIRIHGHLHLGNVLCSGSRFTILDFEGEPGKSVGERRLKRSPLRDVAQLLASLRGVALEAPSAGGWPDAWERRCGAELLAGYLEVGRQGSFLPATEREVDSLLGLHVLELVLKAEPLDFDWLERLLSEGSERQYH